MNIFFQWLLAGAGLVVGLLVVTTLLAKLKVFLFRMAAKNTQQVLKRFYDGVDYSRATCIIDETSVNIIIGKRKYQVKPLKYRELLTLLTIFDQVLEDYKDNGKENITYLLQHNREAIVWAVTYVLLFSRLGKHYTDNDLKKEFLYLNEELTWNDLLILINIVIMQNDLNLFSEKITRFAGQLSNDKKKI